MDESYKEIFEAAMVCLICPTATAAAVITGKLGGSASSLTTYTLLSNILAAIAVPLIFPLVEPHTDVTFGIAFLKILSKVFPLLLAPVFYRFIIPLLSFPGSTSFTEISYFGFLFMGGSIDHCNGADYSLFG